MTVLVNEISGFVEFLPEEQMVFDRLKRIITKHYELFGFVPIETAAVEREDVLLSKSGENTKQIYGIHLLNRSDQEHGDSGTGLALHFDLTVPLARYVALNYGHLTFPFRRYQIQKVWRGERTQKKKGRVREFYQCDIDVIGEENLSLMHDAEMPFVIYQIFSEMNIGKFMIRMNNRKITSGIVAAFGLPETYVGGSIDDERNVLKEDGKERFTFSLLDPIDKVGTDLVVEALRKFHGMEASKAHELVNFVTHTEETPQAMIAWLNGHLDGGGERFATGVTELSEVVNNLLKSGMDPKCFMVDLGITRGLDYYTGTVYETTLVGHESIGSICSGGRFDDLASTFIDRKLPGVGISIGLTRLFIALTDRSRGIIPMDGLPQSSAKVLILNMHPDLQDEYFRMATELRAKGVACEVYLEDRKIDKQTKYAVKKRIPYVVFLDQKRKERGVCTVRHFEGDEQEVPLEKLVEHLR